MTSGTGTAPVKYDQAGSANYNAAPEVTESVTAQKAGQTITVTTHAPATRRLRDAVHGRGDGRRLGQPGHVLERRAGARTSGATFTMTSGTGTCTGQVRPGRERELQRRARGDRVGDRAEGGPGDHGHDARALDGRVRHVVHGCGDGAGRRPRHVLERRRLLELSATASR